MLEQEQRRPLRRATTASRMFDDEAVVISPTENVVRMFNASASRIWELADGSHTVEEIAVELTREFDVSLPEARQAVLRFTSELADRQLIDWTE
jgi:type III secretory pathway lipoprotein EscJ